MRRGAAEIIAKTTCEIERLTRRVARVTMSCWTAATRTAPILKRSCTDNAESYSGTFTSKSRSFHANSIYSAPAAPPKPHHVKPAAAAAAGGTPCFAHSLRGRHPLILNFRTDFQFRCFFCQTVMSFLRVIQQQLLPAVGTPEEEESLLALVLA